MIEKPAGIDALTARQKEILRLIAAHHQEKEIARQLGISVTTVKDHTAVARRHLGVTSSRAAALILVRYEAQTGTLPEAGYTPGPVASPADAVSVTLGEPGPDTARGSSAGAGLTASPLERTGFIHRLKTLPLPLWLGMICLVALGSILFMAVILALVLGSLGVIEQITHYFGW